MDLVMGKNHLSHSIRQILRKVTYDFNTKTFDNEKAFAEHRAIGFNLGFKT